MHNKNRTDSLQIELSLLGADWEIHVRPLRPRGQMLTFWQQDRAGGWLQRAWLYFRDQMARDMGFDVRELDLPEVERAIIREIQQTGQSYGLELDQHTMLSDIGVCDA
jgi:hypothetical protein